MPPPRRLHPQIIPSAADTPVPPALPFPPAWLLSVLRSLPPWPPAPRALDLPRAPPSAGGGSPFLEMSLAAEVGSAAYPPLFPPPPPPQLPEQLPGAGGVRAVRERGLGGGEWGGRGVEFCPKSRPCVSLIRVVMYCHTLRDPHVSAGALSPRGRCHRPQRGAAPCQSPREWKSRWG